MTPHPDPASAGSPLAVLARGDRLYLDADGNERDALADVERLVEAAREVNAGDSADRRLSTALAPFLPAEDGAA